MEKLVSEVTYNVLMGTLKPTYSLTQMPLQNSWQHPQLGCKLLAWGRKMCIFWWKSPFISTIMSADDDLFKQILSNLNHVLAPLLPDKTESY